MAYSDDNTNFYSTFSHTGESNIPVSAVNLMFAVTENNLHEARTSENRREMIDRLGLMVGLQNDDWFPNLNDYNYGKYYTRCLVDLVVYLLHSDQWLQQPHIPTNITNTLKLSTLVRAGRNLKPSPFTPAKVGRSPQISSPTTVKACGSRI
jgi:regulation of enolase protein 1 (concanavalin A-like superfamily)